MAQTNEYNRRVEQRYKHLFEAGNSYSLYDAEAGFVNLTAGAPGPDLLAKCCEIFEVGTQKRMALEKDDQAILFQYGPALGRVDFREALAKFLTKEYHSEVNSNDLILTTGATQGLHLTLSTMVDFNGVIFVDEVTYMIALDVMGQFPTMKIVTVPMNEDGVDVARLRELVAAHRCEASNGKPFWGIYYTMSVHHNPTGRCYSDEICREIVKIARKYELLVLTEDVYNMLSYSDEGVPPKRLFEYDQMSDKDYRGNVISNGTFSKILAPGVRVGWMECPPRCVRVMDGAGVMRSGGATNNYTSGILTTLLDLGLVQQLLASNREIYKQRMVMACEVLAQHLPESCQFVAPSGGYFIWIRFPSEVMASEFNAYARETHHVSAIVGNVFSAENKFKNCTRLSIAFHGIDTLRTALIAFCKAYTEYAKRAMIE